MSRVFLSVAAIAAACSAHGGCARPDLARRIEARIRAANAEVSVAFEDLATGERVALGADRSLHAASTMKIAVMLETYRQAAAGELRLDDPVPVRNEFRSLVDGSLFSVERTGDADPVTHDHIGKTLSIETLVRRMIVRSSNLATNLLIERLSAARVTALCRALGAHATHIRRGVEDGKAFRAGIVNTTTAGDLVTLLRAIAERRVPHADAMRAVLLAQELNDGIPAGLPRGTAVAHKTGSIASHYHDAAIVLPDGRQPYLLAVMTRGLPDARVAAPMVAEISRLVWEHAGRAGTR
jgi:beta-lactamase class A